VELRTVFLPPTGSNGFLGTPLKVVGLLGHDEWDDPVDLDTRHDELVSI